MATIPLSKGAVAIIDDDMLEVVKALPWHLHSNGYAVSRTGVPRRTVRLHRLVMQAPEGMDVDHINGNRLDNRRNNLRICTRGDNLFNNTAVGAWLDKRRGTWQVQTQINKVKYNFGSYMTKEEATTVFHSIKEQLQGFTRAAQ